MKIIIIDDNSINAAINKAYVDKLYAGESVIYSDPLEALKFCVENVVDMVLVDYRMPVLDGLGFIKKFREIKGTDDVPVIMITSVEDRDVLRKALESGANDFLTKPVDEIELRARARNMLSLRAKTLELRRLATTDGLTATCNRRFFFECAEREFSRSERHLLPLSVAILDADNFKRINDRFGHAAGDQVLRLIGANTVQLVRNTDIIGRVGGEEFAICMPDTVLDNANIMLERIRKCFAMQTIKFNGCAISFTVSGGVAEYKPSDKNFSQLLDRADKALYQAKEAGRNQIVKTI